LDKRIGIIPVYFSFRAKKEGLKDTGRINIQISNGIATIIQYAVVYFV
jgi:hypothetical protein